MLQEKKGFKTIQSCCGRVSFAFLLTDLTLLNPLLPFVSSDPQLDTVIFKNFWLCWVFVVVRGLLIAVASLVAEHGL